VPAAGIVAAVLTVTVVGPQTPGHLAVWASGSARPGTSNVNFRPGQDIANTVLAPVGPDGRVQLFNGSPGPLDVVVDVNGYVASPADSSAVGKVLIIVEENHGYAAMTAQMPYLVTLANRFGYATDFHALTHPSLPNYLALAAGSTFGVTTDCSVASCPQSGSTVFDQAIAAGRTARVYAEDMSTNCQLAGWGDGLYAVRHTAWPYFTDAISRSHCLRSQVAAGSMAGGNFLTDASTGALPTVGWLIPNLCNDAHQPGCSLAGADRWLKARLSAIFAGPDWRSGRLAIVVTADEDEGTANNNILTVVLHPSLHGRVVTTALNTYSLTRFQEQIAGVPYLNRARTAADFASAFGLTSAN
jgi:acid phosphatase